MNQKRLFQKILVGSVTGCAASLIMIGLDAPTPLAILVVIAVELIAMVGLELYLSLRK